MNNKTKTIDQTDELAALLKENPDIFIEQPNLLSQVNLPDPSGTGSLLQLQIKGLRQQLDSAETRYRSLIHIARDNQSIVDKLAHVSDVLILSNSYLNMLKDLENLFKSLFEVSELSCKLEIDQTSQTEDYNETIRRITQRKPVCDNRFPSKVLNYLFREPVGSAAIIPLYLSHKDEPIGILALASANEQHYTQDLGTAHLERLGSMVANCVSRLRPNTK